MLKLSSFCVRVVQRRTISLYRNLEMRVVGLVSGGKDSSFNLLKCVAESHEIVALATLKPKSAGELDSFMYQTAGTEVVEAIAQAMGLPLYTRIITGRSLNTSITYDVTSGDEVEDLYDLLREVKEKSAVEAVSVGAVLSDYQRLRVEHVCSRLGLTCLSYLWCNDQVKLLQEMLDCHIDAVLVKVACIGLDPQVHIGKSVKELQPYLLSINEKYGVHVCGEGGEYETLTLDSPLYNTKIVIDESEIVEHDKATIAPVSYLVIKKYHLEPKDPAFTSLSWADRVKQLPIRSSEVLMSELLSRVTPSPVVPFVKRGVECLSAEWPSQFETFVYTTENEVLCSLRAGNTGDLAKDAGELMQRLGDVLAANNMTSSNISWVLLYVSDMANFANINAVYSKFYGVYPPPRLCVEAVLPSSSLIHAQVLASREPKETRSVQSISHWGPSCIGPYSQAAKVGGFVYVSGQIPLVPGSMKVLASGFAGQSQLAFNHVNAVSESMSMTMKHAVTAHCYLVREEDVQTALDLAKTALPYSVKPVCIIVPRIPRDAVVEWHMVFNSNSIPMQTASVCGDSIDDMYARVAAEVSRDKVYFTFYSAGTITAADLMAGLSSHAPSTTFIPIPVSKVVTDPSQLCLKHHIFCSEVPGLTSLGKSKL